MRVRLTLVLVTATAALAGGAHAASAGVIEVCKSATNGMAGKPFTYAVSGGSSITVYGGRCSGPITVGGGSVTVTEGVSDPATDVASILVRPSIRKQSADLAGRSVTVTPGASTSSETLVNFVNEPAGGAYGGLKICKVTETQSWIGRSFSFSVNGGPLVSTEANFALGGPGTWTCRLVGFFPLGSLVTVQEQLLPGTHVGYIDAEPNQSIVDFDVEQGWMRLRIDGATTMIFDNEPLAPSGAGYLEICKDRAHVAGSTDDGVQGSYSFAVTDAAGATENVSVLAGQCSEPLAVAAGLAQVQELPSAGTSVSAIFTLPAGRLLTANLVNRTAAVEVPVSGDPADETQVHFVNQAQRGQFKICKALGASSASLAGTTYTFDWRTSTGASGTLPITAALSTQCRIVGDFPTGTEITVSERNPGAFVDSQGVGTVRIGSGVSTLTVTNTASGVLEICKARIDGLATQPTFKFRVDASSATTTVQAGKCSMPTRVAIGTHTVTELPDDRYELDASRRDGGIAVFPADREVARNLNLRTVTVTVPFGGEGETLVTFYNRTKQALLKVCKTIPSTSQDALGTKEFEFTVDISGFTLQVVRLRPGECTFPFGPFPIPDNDFSVFVDETVQPGFAVESISVTGGVVTQKTATSVFIRPAPGMNVVTFRNRATDP
jgi:hypothetical protein